MYQDGRCSELCRAVGVAAEASSDHLSSQRTGNCSLASEVKQGGMHSRSFHRYSTLLVDALRDLFFLN
jgi:hypothetical protein